MSAADMSRARSALSYLSPDMPRDDWVKVGMAIKAELGEEGFEMFDEWSRQSDRYVTRDTRDTWKSCSANGGIGGGTLFYLAQKSGWHDNGTCQKPSPEELAERRRIAAERTSKEDAERDRRHADAREKAAAILEGATGDAATHPYAIKKRVPFGPLVRRGLWPQRGWTDALLVPIYGGDGHVCSIQAINADGDKDFLAGGRIGGGFHPFGKVRGADRVLIAEGLADAAVGSSVDGSPAAAAMGKSNLLHAALAVREFAPEGEIIILADNDLNVPREAQDAARAVGGRGASPHLGSRKCDFWDLWQERGDEAVQRAIAGAKAPAGDEPRSGNGASSGGAAATGERPEPAPGRREAVVLRVADVEPEPIRWLWPGRIAQGKLTLLAGDPGLGKSLFTLALAAHVTRGTPWPIDSTECTRGDVLILSGEDDIADTIRPRLDAADADPSHVHVLTMIQDLDPDTEMLRLRSFSLRRDIAQLDEVVAERPECRLVIIDPISAYLEGTDSHNNSDVRGVLAPLAELAARRKVAVVAVSHLNKGGHGSAMYRTTGSLAFVAAARAVYLVGKDKDNPDRRLVLPVKNNLAADNTGIAYSIGVGDNDAPNVMWESDPVTVTADEALASTPAECEESRPKLSTAKEWLKEMLKDGPMLVEDIKKEARAAGVAWRTLEEAKADLGFKSEKGEFSGKWSWVRQDRKDPPAKARAPRSSAEANNDAGSSEDRNRGLGAGTSPRASGEPDCEVF